ncbi:MAG: hypothetical protein K1X72_06395 [Pyrinomonadaceae bacterium]|nr:hypothetical protein [Pyrinomonadaceae bacterium]
MKFILELFICFIFPIIVIAFYFKKFASLEDSVFKIGLINTINFMLWFSQILTIRFWGMSGLNSLIFLYLIFIAPILSIGFCYYIFSNKKYLAKFQFPLASSVANIGLPLIIILGSTLF